MREHRWTFFLVIVVVLLLVVYSAAFTVDFKQIAIVKTFGRTADPIHGATRAGLHWKWPWPIQSLVRYDARTFVFEDTFEQVQTRDKQNFLVTVFCGWRIEDPILFLRRIRTVAQAEDRLRDALRSTKSDVVGKHLLADFVNTDPKKMAISDIEKEIEDAVGRSAAEDYGVAIVALGIRSLALPKSVTQKVIENMKEERNREAKAYLGRGEAVADEIISRAETARDQIHEFALAKAKRIRAEGDEAAAKYYAEFKRDPAFAMFLRELEYLQETFKNNAVFLLDPSVQHAIGFFRDGPSLPPVNRPTTQPAKPGK